MKPILVGMVDIKRAGGGKGLIGDLDGDGMMELVVVQANNDIDDHYVPHQITCITVYRLNGELMWQYGKPGEEPGNFGSDFPAQVYDIDGDGFLEILCVVNEKFLILDGCSGKIKQEHSLPAQYAHDCIVICNLTGSDYPRDILLKDRYSNLWALNHEFELLWTFQGNIGHYPWVYDINGDGYDEVIAGYHVLDHKGNLLWSCSNLEEHADCIWVGDVNGDGKPEIAIGGSAVCLYDVLGNELWRYEGSVEAQHIALGQFGTNRYGLWIAGLDRVVRGDGYKGQWDGIDAMFMLDRDGKEVWKETRQTKGWLTIIETIHGWNYEDRDYILAYRRGGGVYPTIYSGNMEPIVEFDKDGYVLHGDLFGRGCEDVIVYNSDTAYVYSGAFCDISKMVRHKAVLQTKRLYSSTFYPGGEY